MWLPLGFRWGVQHLKARLEPRKDPYHTLTSSKAAHVSIPSAAGWGHSCTTLTFPRRGALGGNKEGLFFVR